MSSEELTDNAFNVVIILSATSLIIWCIIMNFIGKTLIKWYHKSLSGSIFFFLFDTGYCSNFEHNIHKRFK